MNPTKKLLMVTVLLLASCAHAPIPPDRATCLYRRVIADLRRPGPRQCQPARNASVVRETNTRCIYESGSGLTGSPFLTQDVAALTSTAGAQVFASVARDCAVSLAQQVPGQPLPPLTSAAQAGLTARFASLAALPRAPPNAQRPVRIAIIDSATDVDAPTSEPDMDASMHAFAIGSAAAAAVCGGPCPSTLPLEIRSYQALTTFISTPDGVVPIGSWTTLAHAIDTAVAEATVAGVDLILNLSIAWEAEYGSSFNQPGPDEVKRALDAAIAAGAWIFAASGNKGEYFSGPMLPAAWEGTFANPRFRAVGALSTPSTLLSIGRDGAVAGLLAMGSHFVAQAPSGASGCGREVWTGTSIATAIVSGSAARVALAGGDINAMLNSAPATSWQRTFGYPGFGEKARLVTPCRRQNGETCSPDSWSIPGILCGKTKPAPFNPSWTSVPVFAPGPSTPSVAPQPGSSQCPVCICRGNSLELRFGGIVADPTGKVAVSSQSTGPRAFWMTSSPPSQGLIINEAGICSASNGYVVYAQEVGGSYPPRSPSELLIVP